jgi:hypothetical protein
MPLLGSILLFFLGILVALGMVSFAVTLIVTFTVVGTSGDLVIPIYVPISCFVATFCAMLCCFPMTIWRFCISIGVRINRFYIYDVILLTGFGICLKVEKKITKVLNQHNQEVFLHRGVQWRVGYDAVVVAGRRGRGVTKILKVRLIQQQRLKPSNSNYCAII